MELAILALLWLAPAQAELRYEVRHEHWRKHGTGTLVINEQGISFEEVRKPHSARWSYQDIQQLYLAPNKLVVLTYKDRKWLLGADKAYEFTLPPGQTFQEVYVLLKDRLDQRLVAALPDEPSAPLWEIPVKLQGRITGSEGTLEIGADRITYKTTRREQSRTWRFQDIDNVSTSGPFQLTVTTFERAKFHYGNRKAFNFQLKQPLDENRFNDLWRRLNQRFGLISHGGTKGC